MSTMATPVEEVERICRAALMRAGATPANAEPVAKAIARAEADGNRVCGLYYLPVFCAQLRSGKVDGRAVPRVERSGAAVRVDAMSGFAHPAIAAGLPVLIEAAREIGVAAMTVRRSTNCLALSHFVLPLAAAGLIGFCTANSPASMAPSGAVLPVFGTNPVAFAVPGGEDGPIVVDQSMSAVTKTAMMMRRDRGEAIPLGWGQDAGGNPTTDPDAALAGSLLPAGGQKGANLALLTEILAAVLAGSQLSSETASFGTDDDVPSDTGQFLLALDPSHFAGALFAPGVARLTERFTTAGIRMPGRRNAPPSTVIEPDPDLWREAMQLAAKA